VPKGGVGNAERRRDARDKLIAAHALALDVALVTKNPRDFASYPDLRIENWVDCSVTRPKVA
jgi:tRNA(fMet)-specific endonuclease VapC